MYNHYFDDTNTFHPYTYSLIASAGTLPPRNALRGDKPVVSEGFWPCEQGGVWVNIEDHRKEEGYLNGEPFVITDLGPYPDGWSTAPPPLTQQEQLDAFTAQVQERLDVFAQTKGYDNMMAVASYGCSTNATYLAEGEYAIEARDLTWAKWYQIYDDVLSEVRTMPTWDQIVAELPPLEWPTT